jgi:hypothetical protein
MTNPARPGQRRPAETDPRNARAPAPAPRYPQAPQNPAHPQAAYPEQQPQNPGYDPQSAYHYPQQPQQPQYPQAPAARPTPRQAGPDPITQPGAADYGAYPSTQPPFGHGQQTQPQQRNLGPAPARQTAAPSFPAPSFPGPSEPRTAPPSYDQWGASAPQQDPRGFDPASYMPNGALADLSLRRGPVGNGAYAPDPLQQQAEWVHAAQIPYGDAGLSEQQGYAGNQLGFDQPHHPGALEATHNHDEAGDYEYDEPRRGSWVLRIAGAIVVAVGLGYGLAQGYKMILGGPADPGTPVVKGDSAPAKTVPTDPGGKQFAHADSKVMGRLGDGPPASDETGSATPTDTDSGTRKVQTVVVGRDGAIVPPAAPVTAAEPAPPPAAEPPNQSVAVPGLTVIDGFGGRYPGSNSSTNNVTTAAVPPQKPAATPPASKAAKHAKAKAATPPPAPAADADTAAIDETPAPAAKAPPAAKKQVAAADPTASAGANGANGYVVVLASIPATGSSRLDALKRFADMQEKYGTVLANKTPEVQEANLGDKGMFNRLLVGPPGSRSQASQLCTELKAAGYKDCWVTAY